MNEITPINSNGNPYPIKVNEDELKKRVEDAKERILRLNLAENDLRIKSNEIRTKEQTILESLKLRVAISINSKKACFEPKNLCP